MYLTRIMTTINTSQSCRPTFDLIFLTWRSTQDEDLGQPKRFTGKQYFPFPHSKILIFSPYITPILSIRRSRQEREVGQEALSELKRFTFLLALSDTYSTVWSPFLISIIFSIILNLANFLTIFTKPLRVSTNNFKEHREQLARKFSSPFARQLNLIFSFHPVSNNTPRPKTFLLWNQDQSLVTNLTTI